MQIYHSSQANAASDFRFAASFLFYGLSLNIGSFGLNIYLTQLIFGTVEIPANVACLTMIQRFGRRICQASFLFLGGVSCLVATAVPRGNHINCLMFSYTFFLFISIFLFAKHICFIPTSPTCGCDSHCYDGKIFCYCCLQYSLCLYS